MPSYLSTYKFAGNKEGYRNFFNSVGATNYNLTDEPRSRGGWIMDRVRAARPSKILEIGSQTGGITTHLLKACQDVTCIDIVQAQLDIVRGLGAKTHLCFVEDLHTLSIGKFDVVLITEVLNHVLDAEVAASNAWAKVGKGGHLIVTVPHGDRWIDQCVARRFDCDEDLANLLRVGTGLKEFQIDHLDDGGQLYFYACDVCKP
jgi:2-polyprenyl-3-methyl-5-hydroxy-6-metoxy-1,4-benzoquinol methylase